MAIHFKLSIGSKRQVTFPSRLMEQLALKEGDTLEASIVDGAVSLVPMVSVPRHVVSQELLDEVQARRGAKPNDLSLAEFKAWRKTRATASKPSNAASVSRSTLKKTAAPKSRALAAR